MKVPESIFYKHEVALARTEHLLGNDIDMVPLDFDDPRIKYYVSKRSLSCQNSPNNDANAEEQLFAKFWPRGRGEQLIQIIGGAGSGKSTFIRYFLQYYLPHRSRLTSEELGSTIQSEVYDTAFRSHIFLYADLRRPNPEGLRPYVFQLIADSLFKTAKRIGLHGIVNEVGPRDEDWLRRAIQKIAKESIGNRRKWYISWIFDNADQMDQRLQRDLLSIISDYITEEQRADVWATSPVTEWRDCIWRVFLPVRPETQTNFECHSGPWANRTSINLPPVDADSLIKKRAVLLAAKIESSEREYTSDYLKSPGVRAYHDGNGIAEIATSFAEDLVAAHEPKPENPSITDESRLILDNLVNGSARRRLTLTTKAATSRSFRERYRIGLQKGWAFPVSSFYFFDGLIRGDADMFRPSSEAYLLNLYGLGSTKLSAHSLCVGLHSIVLLDRGMSWNTVKKRLGEIGYGDNDLLSCESYLLAAEIIKPLWVGDFLTESNIVKGYWSLLKERAYTDNMAIACAHSWGVPDKAPVCDFLDNDQLIVRLNSSLWFMKEVSRLELLVSRFSTTAQLQGVEFRVFARRFDNLRLPRIASHILGEYDERTRKFPFWENSQAAISADRIHWEKWRSDLVASRTESEREFRARQ